MAFADIGELHHALESNAVTLHAKIQGSLTRPSIRDGKPVSKIYDTTPGPHAHWRDPAEKRQRALRHRQSGDDQEEHLSR